MDNKFINLTEDEINNDSFLFNLETNIELNIELNIKPIIQTSQNVSENNNIDTDIFIDTFSDNELDNTENDIDIANDTDNTNIGDINTKFVNKSNNTNRIDKIEEAVKRYKNGDSEAINEIFKYYDPIIKRWAYRSSGSIHERENMYSDMIGMYLLDALDKYDINGGSKFNTYYQSRLKWCAGITKKRADSYKRKSIKNSISCDKTYGDDNVSLLDVLSSEVDEKTVSSDLEIAINNLNLKDNEKSILILTAKGYTLNEIASVYNVTPAGIKMALKRVGKKIPKIKNILYSN